MNIFIDTVIFEENNFLESSRINQLLKLSEDGDINIIMPIVTYKEILARAKSHIKSSISLLNGARKKTNILRNIPTIQNRFDILIEKDNIAEFNEEFDKRIKKANCIILNYPKHSTEHILDNYFANSFPFNKGDKKHEFPDAFALASVEEWCINHSSKCHILSNDKDMHGYQSEYFIIEKDYKMFLENTLKGINEGKLIINQAIDNFHHNTELIKTEIKNWALGKLDDERIYYKLIDYLEIFDINVKYFDVEFENIRAVSLDSEYVELEAEAIIYFEVVLEIPDQDSAWFDDEEREWHYIEKTTKTVIQQQSIPVNISSEIEKESESYIYIDSINNNNPLSIKDDTIHYK